jgi:hypothetical protein
MRKLIYKITPSGGTMGRGDSPYTIEFVTDRTPEWTEQQYLRNREPLTMELISNEATKETKAVSREI